jgi:hypothetical protein
MPDKVIALRGPGNIVKTTASGTVAGTSITVSTTAGITAGMSVTGGAVSTTATVVSVGTNQVTLDAGNTGSFTDQAVFFTEWDNLLVSAESVVVNLGDPTSSNIAGSVVARSSGGSFDITNINATTLNSSAVSASAITASTITVSTLSASTTRIAGFTASGRITGTGSISTSSWVSAATAGFTVKSNFSVSGVTSLDYPQVNFGLSSYTVATNAELSLVEASTGSLIIYGQSTPSSIVSFNYIVIKG